MPTRLARLLVLLLCVLFCGERSALAAASDEVASSATIVHAQIVKRGVGHAVKLVRTDGSEIKGRITTVRDGSVEIQSQGSTLVSNVQYTDVAKVKGPGLSTGAKVGIGIGVGVVVCVGIAAIVINHEISKPWNF